MAKPQRYDQILKIIDQIKPKKIVEVGVFNGDRAVLMSKTALKHNKDVEYVGYDLFEEANHMTNTEEMNAKKNHSMSYVADKLGAFQRDNIGFKFHLIKGNTRETLGGKTIEADFAYIDGGHTVETIRNDYDALKTCPVVVFDDYYKDSEFDLDKVGCNKLIEELGGEVLPSTDPLSFQGKRSGTVHLARYDRPDPSILVEVETTSEVSEELEKEYQDITEEEAKTVKRSAAVDAVIDPGDEE